MILSNGTITCCETCIDISIQMPGDTPPVPYVGGMYEGISYPNGTWKLYIYGTNNCSYSLDGWKLDFQGNW